MSHTLTFKEILEGKLKKKTPSPDRSPLKTLFLQNEYAFNDVSLYKLSPSILFNKGKNFPYQKQAVTKRTSASNSKSIRRPLQEKTAPIQSLPTLEQVLLTQWYKILAPIKPPSHLSEKELKNLFHSLALLLHPDTKAPGCKIQYTFYDLQTDYKQIRQALKKLIAN